MSTYIPVELQQKIRTHFANCCAYCRTAEVLTATTFEFEHIQPRSVGGQTIWENLCLACPSCNRYKANRILDFGFWIRNSCIRNLKRSQAPKFICGTFP
jgi:5-methylcytosine-specific restriction endonuclease McrA